jgi:hypothetical protein
MLWRGLLGVALPALLAVGLFALTNRLLPENWTGMQHELHDKTLLDHVTGLIRAIFAFVFALVVVTTWQDYTAARQNTPDEASALETIYWNAHGMSDPAHHLVQARVRDYTNSVIEYDWPLMAWHQMSAESPRFLNKLRDQLITMSPQGPQDRDMQVRALTSLRHVEDARHKRILAVTHGLPTFLWIALIVGALLTVIPPLFAGTPFTVRNIALIVILTIVVSSALWLVHELDFAYSGPIHVEPDAYRQIRDEFPGIS